MRPQRLLLTLRLLTAVWAAKLAGVAIRAIGRQGTHTPGLIARRLYPGILGAIRHPARVVAVTGTNGKTTVSNLLTEPISSLMMMPGLALGAMGLGVAVSELPWGLATDRWGDRPILLTGLLATAIGLLCMALFVTPSHGSVPSLPPHATRDEIAR